MNPVFWLLLLFGAIALWFIISPIFTFVGRSAKKKFDKTVEILNKEETKDEPIEEKENEHE